MTRQRVYQRIGRFLVSLALPLLFNLTRAWADPTSPIEELRAQNMYERLGVKPSATKEEISKANASFRRANAEAINRGDASIRERAGLIGEAFQTLRKVDSRVHYDARQGFDSKIWMGPKSEAIEFVEGTINDRPQTKEEFLESFKETMGGMSRPESRLNSDVEVTLERLEAMSHGPLNSDQFAEILSLMKSPNIYVRFAEQVRIAEQISFNLSKTGPWPKNIWDHIESNIENMRRLPWSTLTSAVKSRSQWPPSFRTKVEKALNGDRALIRNAEVNKAKNMRLMAVDLFLSRDKREIPAGVLSALETYLSAHPNSDLFGHAVNELHRLEKAGVSRTEKIDELLVAGMQKIFRNDASQMPSRGPYPNNIMKLLVHSRSIPAGMWAALVKEAKTASDPHAFLSVVDLLAQRHDVPDSVSELFFKRMDGQMMPTAFSIMGLGRGTTSELHLSYFGLDPKSVTTKHFRCSTIPCIKELINAAERNIDFSNRYQGGRAYLS